jgi:hypothetical protein
MAGARYYGAAASLGIAAGSLAYRYLAIPGASGPIADVLQTIPLVAGLGAFFLIRSLDNSNDRRPPWVLLGLPFFIGVAVIGTLAFRLAPPHAPLAEQTFVTRALPGFTIDLPSAKEKTANLDYRAGKLELAKLGGRMSALHLGWQFAEATDEATVLELGRAAGPPRRSASTLTR